MSSILMAVGKFSRITNRSDPCCGVNVVETLWFSRNDFLHTTFAVILLFRERMVVEK